MAYALAMFTGFTTSCRPTRPHATTPHATDFFRWGILPPSSRHQGWMPRVVEGDGAVRFVTDSINTGVTAGPMVSHNGSGGTLPLGLQSLWTLGVPWGRKPTKKRLPSHSNSRF